MDTMNTDSSEDKRLISDDEAGIVIDKIADLIDNKEGTLLVSVSSLWYGSQRWARNRAIETNNVRKTNVRIAVSRRSTGAQHVEIRLNQIDEKSLRDACHFIERELNYKYKSGFYEGLDLKLDSPTWDSKGIPVWSDATYSRTAKENSELVTHITERAESNGIMCSGSIDTSAAHFMGYTRDGWGREEREKGHATMAECSTTVRHPKGIGSGWAGASSFDLKRLDLKGLGEKAFDKCMRSVDPVRIEPGRYQTILEPQATAAFAQQFFELFQARVVAERSNHPLFLEYDQQIMRGRSRIGLRIADRRLSISHDPENPITGSHPYKAVQKADFLKEGVLTEMARDYTDYSLPQLSTTDQVPLRYSFEMTSTEITTIDEMISATERGLLLTRVSGMDLLHGPSALYTGLTRDGLWLIEKGKISKAVRNFRWTESPVFIFNNVESVGESVPVMSTWYQQFPFMQHSLQLAVPSVAVPTIKINDFSFTSTIDAI